MSHKSKADRQREAQERKRKDLPRQEARLAEALAHARAQPNCEFSASRLVDERLALERAYLDTGHSRVMALGMANAAAAGRPGSWLSAPEDPLRAVEPDSIDDAVLLLTAAEPRVVCALLTPHPFLPAILVRTGALEGGKSLVVRLSILQIDALATDLQRHGIAPFKSEAPYAEQLCVLPDGVLMRSTDTPGRAVVPDALKEVLRELLRTDASGYTLRMFWLGRGDKFSRRESPLLDWLTRSHLSASLAERFTGFEPGRVWFQGEDHQGLATGVMASAAQALAASPAQAHRPPGE